MQSQSRRAEDGARPFLACDCEGPIKSDCLNAIFISMAIEFLHNLAKQRLRPPARALPFRGTAPCARVRRIRELELSRWYLLQNDGFYLTT